MRPVEDYVQFELTRSLSEMFPEVPKSNRIIAYNTVVEFLNSSEAHQMQAVKQEKAPGLVNYFQAARVLAQHLLEQGYSDDNFNLLFTTTCGGLFEDPFHGICAGVRMENFDWDIFSKANWKDQFKIPFI